jgi:hypothetical protein
VVSLFVSLISVRGTTAPLGSKTVPRSVPRYVCASTQMKQPKRRPTRKSAVEFDFKARYSRLNWVDKNLKFGDLNRSIFKLSKVPRTLCFVLCTSCLVTDIEQPNTPHKARSTKYEAQSTKHKEQSTTESHRPKKFIQFPKLADRMRRS